MELLGTVSSTQFLFPAAAVAVVLVCAALVFIFGFHSAEQPQFDKLPLVVDDRKSSNKKRKPKDKVSANNMLRALLAMCAHFIFNLLTYAHPFTGTANARVISVYCDGCLLNDVCCHRSLLRTAPRTRIRRQSPRAPRNLPPRRK